MLLSADDREVVGDRETVGALIVASAASDSELATLSFAGLRASRCLSETKALLSFEEPAGADVDVPDDREDID